MSGVNWNVELKKLEREFGGLPPEPTPGQLNARRMSERRAQQHQDAVNATIGATSRILLIVGLAIGLYFWPYARACGAGLFAYMGAEALIGAGALWVAAYTWRNRMPKTHGVAVAMLFCGLALIAVQILPRIGYATARQGQSQQWFCAEGSK
jgi:hypothetical protein